MRVGAGGQLIGARHRTDFRNAVVTLLTWPKGWIFEKTEIRPRD